MLHNDKELFEQIVLRTSDALGIEAGIVEKDYFVTVFLKQLVAQYPNIIFKGGTSLSKCYKLINRFSEDIDLNVLGETKPSESQRRKLRDAVVGAIDTLNFSLSNSDDIYSRRDFNKYVIDYPTVFTASHLKPKLVVETAVFFRAYPTIKMEAGSYIYDYLSQNSFESIIEQYNLQPFELNVQTAERTFVDKLFAIGDYYLSRNVTEHSRHIYDVYKLLTVVEINDTLKELAEEVREERKPHKTCLSAQDDIDMNALIHEIVEMNAFKDDYEEITTSLLFETVDYETVIESLNVVIRSGLFS